MAGSQRQVSSVVLVSFLPEAEVTSRKTVQVKSSGMMLCDNILLLFSFYLVIMYYCNLSIDFQGIKGWSSFCIVLE